MFFWLFLQARKRQLEQRLGEGGVLLLVLDLTTWDQLAEVLPCAPGPGSYLIITSRDKKLVHKSIGGSSCYMMEAMGPGAALQLFRSKAEVESLPPELEVGFKGYGAEKCSQNGFKTRFEGFWGLVLRVFAV